MSKRFHTPRIVQPDGRRVWIFFAVLVVASVVLAWFMFDYGRQSAGFFAEQRESETQKLRERIDTLLKERDTLRLNAAKFQRAGQIDQAAVQAVQDEILSLQQDRAKLQKEVEFLKSLLSGDVTMLQLKDFALQPLTEANQYQYTFTLSKRAKGTEKVRGRVDIRVAGELDGKPKELDIKALGVPRKQLVMGFNHFQKFEGKLTLPAGFVAKSMTVLIKPKGKRFKAFDQNFAWETK